MNHPSTPSDELLQSHRTLHPVHNGVRERAIASVNRMSAFGDRYHMIKHSRLRRQFDARQVTPAPLVLEDPPQNRLHSQIAHLLVSWILWH